MSTQNDIILQSIQRDIKSALKSIKKTPITDTEALIKKLLAKNADVETKSILVDFSDPYETSRISLPVKTRKCQHLETFDVKNMLGLTAQKIKTRKIKVTRRTTSLPPKWWESATYLKCPIDFCKVSNFKFSDLRICDWSLEYLKKLPENKNIKVSANNNKITTQEVESKKVLEAIDADSYKINPEKRKITGKIKSEFDLNGSPKTPPKAPESPDFEIVRCKSPDIFNSFEDIEESKNNELKEILKFKHIPTLFEQKMEDFKNRYPATRVVGEVVEILDSDEDDVESSCTYLFDEPIDLPVARHKRKRTGAPLTYKKMQEKISRLEAQNDKIRKKKVKITRLKTGKNLDIKTRYFKLQRDYEKLNAEYLKLKSTN